MGRVLTVALALAVLSLPPLLWLAIVATPVVLLGVPVALGAAWFLPRLLWPDGPSSLGFGLLAFGALLTFLATWIAFLYAYVIAISAGLCGDGREEQILTIALAPPYLIVGSWALRERGRVLWAWPLAVLAAAAVALLVAYASPSAHGVCET